jgi:hypothetical protein
MLKAGSIPLAAVSILLERSPLVATIATLSRLSLPPSDFLKRAALRKYLYILSTAGPLDTLG